MTLQTAPNRSGILAGRLLDYWLTVARRTWKGTVITSFISPLLYIVAMGVLLGGFIKGDPAKLDGATSYLAFIAPGMVAAQTMTVVFGDLTYPVMGAIKWNKTFYSMIATPLSVRDVVLGQLGFALFHAGVVAAVFLAVMAPFGVFTSVGGVLLAWLVQLLVAFTFAAPLFAYSAWLKSDSGFALVFRLGMIPLFLFSGAFFPLSNLGPVLETIAWLTPLWHGVDLTRMLVLGDIHVGRALVHLAYLVVVGYAGYRLTLRTLADRMAS